jgi:hypothetical protein
VNTLRPTVASSLESQLHAPVLHVTAGLRGFTLDYRGGLPIAPIIVPETGMTSARAYELLKAARWAVGELERVIR